MSDVEALTKALFKELREQTGGHSVMIVKPGLTPRTRKGISFAHGVIDVTALAVVALKHHEEGSNG